MEHQKNSRVLKWSLVAGIVIVLNLFFNYSIYLVYPQPQYQNFCPQPQAVAPAVAPATVQPVQPDYTVCQNNYQAASDVYSRNVFIILVVLGVLSLGISFIVASTPAVSAGLSFGGVLSFIIASGRYWSQAQTILQVIILGVALVALLWLAARRFSE